MGERAIFRNTMGLVLSAVFVAGCLPGTGAGAPPSSAPSDDVFISMLRAIEERRADRFAAAVALTANPDKETIWQNLNTFLDNAEKIELDVTVDRRIHKADEVIYLFSWTRKYQKRDTGETVTDSGESEWSFSNRTGRYLLVQMTGNELF
ncbi:MAG: hypothetical protein D6679_09695 [Candidatus Hydrogenedentota bacterium]|nr:MAG: hypothetical protein D6679_09695 [Candidatus Hydrogenedentota bacterium]